MIPPESRDIGLDVFYPIVPDIDWLARIVPLGVQTVQLRIKDVADEEIRRQIGAALEICARHDCQLIVNDYWRAAIDAGANFIHLGQEDLAEADIVEIKASKLRLGVSTHSDEELAVALSVAPDYVALGPIYETRLKAMPWSPQGLTRVSQWKEIIGDMPLVGIAGITIRRADGVLAAGAQAVAIISDFLMHDEPERRISEWVRWADRHR
ncbi:MAG: thiamine phosphate synthase [Hyphomicrobiaceae bacterium]